MDKVITVNYNTVRDNSIDMNLYSFLKLCMDSGMPFTVCNVTEEEFSAMKKDLDNRGYLSERLVNPEFHNYYPCRWMITRSDDKNKILFADYDNPKKRGAYSFNYETHDLQYNEDEIQFLEYYHLRLIDYGYTSGLKIYTTETYDDVIKHYQDEVKEFHDGNLNSKNIKVKLENRQN